MTEAWNASHARIPHHEPSLSNILLARRTFPPRSITPRTLSNSIPFAGKEGSYIFCMRARVEVVVFSLLLIAIVNLKLSIHALRKSDIGFLHKVNTKPPTFGLNTGPVIGDARHKAQTQDDRS